MTRVGFIADFFDILGGAEKNDSVLISYLSGLHKVDKITSHTCDKQKIDNCDVLIIGNFVNLPEHLRNYIAEEKRYIIYEHDHKYVRTRDPAFYLNFKIPKEEVVNRKFYENANKIICLGNKQRELIQSCINIPDHKIISISSSLWSSDRLNFIESLTKSDMQKKGSYAIVNSSNPIKNTKKAIQYCIDNNIEYSLISNPNEQEFLQELSKHKGLVFFPGVLESMCRLVVEAKMLNCKVITSPALIGASYEPWIKKSGEELINIVRCNIQKALNTFSRAVDGERQER